MIEIVGKGAYIWKVPALENGGDPKTIVRIAQEAGLSHVLIKIANGIYAYNSTNANSREYVTPLVEEFHNNCITVLGWHYVFGDNPLAEAAIAIKRIQETGIDGYVIDAEAEYKANKTNAACIFMAKMRLELPEYPIGLSSYRYPKLHPELPWKEFLSKCNFNMPQVYWEKSHNAGFQLQESKKQFDNLYAQLKIRPLPYIPTGAAYKWDGWQPTENDVNQFLQTAKEMKLTAVNFWEWWCTRVRLPQLWDVIKNFKWDSEPPVILTLEERITRLEKAVFGSQ